MNYKVVNKPAVSHDITMIVAYYNSFDAKLGSLFLDKVEQAKKYIHNFPFAFQIKYKNVRTVLLEQFPYHIHYIIDDENQQIVVLAIIHSHKMPKDYAIR